ncbi:hypothetical protein [Basfia succiniciproducens]|uniref:hypothetical protein n=1 Tax=Basfia succiniciproducens TaxID=653940 RepID=UPI003FCCDEB3
MIIYDKVILIVSLVLGVILGYFFGDNIRFSEQWPLYEALRTTASIIFAVVGAWLAIIYPEKLKAPFRDKYQSIMSSDTRFSSLFSPIANSTIILSCVLVIGIISPIAKQISIFIEYKGIMRSISFGLLCCLTIWQVWTVFITLIPADLLKNKSDIEIARQNNIEHLMGKRKE